MSGDQPRASLPSGIASTLVAETLAASDDSVAYAPTAAGSIPTQPEGERLAPGDACGDYRIVRRIGGGAMGDVYEGEAEAIGKRVAIKVIKNVLSASPDAAERFLREARAVNRIDHPHVLDVFAFGQLDDGRLYLVMDLLVGSSLGEYLRANGALSEARFLELFDPICRAVEAAHAAGIVHRDLKPDNVFLAEQGGATHVYVLDFGIAKLLSDAAAAEGQITLTGEGVWIGTPAYMSPEQWAAEPACAQTDVYALGCTAFEMLSGHVPFKADSVPGIMQKHFNAERPRPTRGEGGAITRRLGDAIAVAMAKEPSDRHPSPSAFLDALHAEPERPAARSHSLPLAAVLLVVALVAMGAFVLWQQTRAEPSNAPAATPDDSTTLPARRWSIVIETMPRTATVSVDGHDDAVGILELSDLPADSVVRATVSAPGYLPREVEFDAQRAGRETVTLTSIAGFEGTWKLGKSRFRQLARHEGGVAVFHLEHENDKPLFLQTFRFTQTASGWIHFEGAVDVADERAPRDASCQFSLASEYRYHTERSALDFRRERVPVRFDRRAGRCVVGTKLKGEWMAAERVTTADSGVIWAESRAGGGLRAYISANPAPRERLRAPPSLKELERRKALLEKRRRQRNANRRTNQRLLDELGNIDTPNLGNVDGAKPTAKPPRKKVPPIKGNLKKKKTKGDAKRDQAQQRMKK